MLKRKLGPGLECSAIGLGCMGMSNTYGPADEAASIATIHKALDLGVDFIDTADAYGEGHNEVLVGKALKDRRSRAMLATKFGNLRSPDGKPDVRGDAAYVKQACEASLKRLGVDHVDLYFQHRVDPRVPIEETVGAMADLVRQGKVRFLGLSEAGAETIAKANATHPIAAVQSEWSLWTRDLEADVIPTCAKLGIGFVAYAPFGRGFLTGTIAGLDDLPEKDRRREHPRFAAEAIARNAALLGALKKVAEANGMTPAQACLAWLLAKSPTVVPIPGTKRPEYMVQNAEAVSKSLSAADVAALDAAFPPGVTSGTRYPEGQMKRLGL